MAPIVTDIRPWTGWQGINLRELWDYRELFLIFAWRDLKVRYKQTILGVAWAIFQPLTSMVIFSFFFGKLARIYTAELPYMVFVYVGIVIWTFFSTAVNHATSSLLEQELLIKRVYFPRIIIPLAAFVTSIVDFLIACSILVVLLIYFQIHPSYWLIMAFPGLFLIVSLTVTGIGLFLSAVNIKYRDVRYILPFFINIAMFLTPVIYPSRIIADQHKWILVINPLTAVIETSRKLLSGSVAIDWLGLGISILVAVTIFIFGLYYFRSTEKYFADVV